MKDLLVQKIELDVKIELLHYMQMLYQNRMDYGVYSDLCAKTNASKKKLITLIEDTGDLTIRNKIVNQKYPFKYYIDNIQETTEK